MRLKTTDLLTKKGKANYSTTAAGIENANADSTATPQPVYSVSGAKVGTTATLSTLPSGVYVINKKKILVK